MKDKVTYPIELDRGTWEKWKKTVPRDKTMNEAIVELILKDLGE